MQLYSIFLPEILGICIPAYKSVYTYMLNMIKNIVFEDIHGQEKESWFKILKSWKINNYLESLPVIYLPFQSMPRKRSSNLKP